MDKVRKPNISEHLVCWENKTGPMVLLYEIICPYLFWLRFHKRGNEVIFFHATSGL
jgi:hypothetical protein